MSNIMLSVTELNDPIEDSYLQTNIVVMDWNVEPVLSVDIFHFINLKWTIKLRVFNNFLKSEAFWYELMHKVGILMS